MGRVTSRASIWPGADAHIHAIGWAYGPPISLKLTVIIDSVDKILYFGLGGILPQTPHHLKQLPCGDGTLVVTIKYIKRSL